MILIYRVRPYCPHCTVSATPTHLDVHQSFYPSPSILFQFLWGGAYMHDKDTGHKKYTLCAETLEELGCTAALHYGERVHRARIFRAVITVNPRQVFIRKQLQALLVHASTLTNEGYVQHHEVPVSAVKLALPAR